MGDSVSVQEARLRIALSHRRRSRPLVGRISAQYAANARRDGGSRARHRVSVMMRPSKYPKASSTATPGPWWAPRLTAVQYRRLVPGQIASLEALDRLGVRLDTYARIRVPMVLLGAERSPSHLGERLDALQQVNGC